MFSLLRVAALAALAFSSSQFYSAHYFHRHVHWLPFPRSRFSGNAKARRAKRRREAARKQ